jgi:hypothetical protein
MRLLGRPDKFNYKAGNCVYSFGEPSVTPASREVEDLETYRGGCCAGRRQRLPAAASVTNVESAGVPRSVATTITGHKTESVYRRYAISKDEQVRAGLATLDLYFAGSSTPSQGIVQDGSGSRQDAPGMERGTTSGQKEWHQGRWSGLIAVAQVVAAQRSKLFARVAELADALDLGFKPAIRA